MRLPDLSGLRLAAAPGRARSQSPKRGRICIVPTAAAPGSTAPFLGQGGEASDLTSAPTPTGMPPPAIQKKQRMKERRQGGPSDAAADDPASDDMGADPPREQDDDEQGGEGEQGEEGEESAPRRDPGQTEARQEARRKLTDERSDWTKAEDDIVRAWAKEEEERAARLAAGTASPRGRGSDGKLKKIKGARLEEMLRSNGYNRSRKAGQERWKRLQARDLAAAEDRRTAPGRREPRDGKMVSVVPGSRNSADNWSPDEDRALRQAYDSLLQPGGLLDKDFWQSVSDYLKNLPPPVGPIDRPPWGCRGRHFRLQELDKINELGRKEYERQKAERKARERANADRAKANKEKALERQRQQAAEQAAARAARNDADGYESVSSAEEESPPPGGTRRGTVDGYDDDDDGEGADPEEDEDANLMRYGYGRQ